MGGRERWRGDGFCTIFIIWSWFCMFASCCCWSLLCAAIWPKCWLRVALVSVRCVKSVRSAANACAKLATAWSRSRFSYTSTLPANPCCSAVVCYILFWTWCFWFKRRRKLLNVFCFTGKLIHFLYSSWYFPVDKTSCSAALSSCS